jgi:tight adherence protein B
MLTPLMTVLGMALLAALAVGGIAYVFLYPLLSGERRSEKRMHSVQRREPRGKANSPANDAQNRRRLVQDTLKELEEKQKSQKKKVTLRAQISQAGLHVSMNVFYALSALVGLLVAGMMMVYGFTPLVSGVAGIVGALGIPRWVVGFLRRRRFKKFVAVFPDAIDVIVRGVKSGLPINDTVRMIASEAQEPVKSEFRHVVEGQAVGMPISEGLERMYSRVPLQEVNFLAIVVTIQSQTGGNLAESLANLSRVLRDRKKLKGKINAMSQEAKSSAAIIAALPFAVATIVYLTTPAYVSLLWEDEMGQLMLMGSGIWMTLGVLVMKKMINFDF